jgi:hypothetical protein
MSDGWSRISCWLECSFLCTMFGDQTLPLSFAITKRSGVVKLLSKYGQSLSFFFSHPLKLFLSFLFYFDWHFGFPILFLLLNMCHAHAFLLVFWPYFSCMSLDSVHIPKSCDCQFSLSLSLSLSLMDSCRTCLRKGIWSLKTPPN